MGILANLTSESKQVEPEIKVLSLKTNPRGGSIKAYCDLQLPCGTQIFDCKIVHEAGKEPWLAPPSKSWKDAAGKNQYSNLVMLSPNLQAACQAAALAAFYAGGDNNG